MEDFIMFDEDFNDDVYRLEKEFAKGLRDFRINEKNFTSSVGIGESINNVIQTDKEIVIKLDIPGVQKKDIFLNVTSNVVEVKVEKKHQVDLEKEGIKKSQKGFFRLYRSILLPVKVIPEKTKASYEDGILELIIPKSI
jgi:HSP20 family protein